ncbi:adenylate kinase [Aureococcus anophagefferens]|uniref:Adenylate kinase n=1 Tax=Aureococcus anophagefferens TaxID=44056 RepID=A0ABR1FXL1_AURAN
MPRTIAALILAVASALVTPPRRKTTTLAARAKTRTPYDFTYASAAERRYAAEAQMRRRSAARGPGGASGLKVVLLGKPASGKGTIAPMLCTAYRVAQVGLGNLLRSRARVGGGDDDAVADAMRSGRLLPDELALSVVAERVSRRDAVACGWLLDGFPRTAAQAARMIKSPPLQVPADLPFDGPPMGDDAYLLTPDAIVVLDRPDDLAVDFVLGRCTDSATGTVYHPKYAPPPEDVEPRLVWRTDDTEEVLRRRLADHDAAVDDILAMFSESCAVLRVDNARSELETFDEICTFLDKVEDGVLGASRRAVRGERARRRYAAPAAFERASTKAARAARGRGRRVEASRRPPLLRMERAAVVAFGVVSYGCHVSGYVAGDDGRPAAVWVATRAVGRPRTRASTTRSRGRAPGGADAAREREEGGRGGGVDPRAVLDRDLRPAGCVSYKYAAKRGLSAKTLVVFDLRLPRELVPMNGDGEVDEFRLVPVDEAVDSLRDELFKWKPNSRSSCSTSPCATASSTRTTRVRPHRPGAAPGRVTRSSPGPAAGHAAPRADLAPCSRGPAIERQRVPSVNP